MSKDNLDNINECERILKKGVLSSTFLNAEERAGFPVTVKDKKIWLIMLDLALEFDKICKKHNLTYFIHYGSLLGAVRHKGFIPWDTNFDVCMPRKDYEKFITLNDEFEYPYFLQTIYTDKGYYYSYSKLRNSNSTGLDRNFLVQPKNLCKIINFI